MRIWNPVGVGELPGPSTEYQWYLNAGYVF
jgi:hypothetical protein